jgi:DNA-binding IclR family transcriptional regulator
MASNTYTKTNMDEVLRQLDGKGFEEEVPRSVLIRTIAEVTDLAHPTSMKQFLRGMHEMGLVEQSGGNIWRIIKEETV